MRLFFISLFLIFSILSCSTKNSLNPKVGPITESIYAIGIVKSERSFELKLGVLTAVKKYFVKEGDIVKTSQPLVMDDSGTVYKAPFAGVITYLPFSLGETVAPQKSILTLVELSRLYLEASVEQQGALKIKSGQNVQISFESFRTQVFHGVVRTILPRNAEFVVQVEVKDLPTNILPGMNADLSIEVMKKSTAILLPLAAVSNGHILLKKGKNPEKIPVTIGVSDSEFVEILSPQLTVQDEIFLPKDSAKK
jgi:multidrug efflux pump subunit AcrA (membrane-fusion protein)